MACMKCIFGCVMLNVFHFPDLLLENPFEIHDVGMWCIFAAIASWLLPEHTVSIVLTVRLLSFLIVLIVASLSEIPEHFREWKNMPRPKAALAANSSWRESAPTVRECKCAVESSDEESEREKKMGFSKTYTWNYLKNPCKSMKIDMLRFFSNMINWLPNEPFPNHPLNKNAYDVWCVWRGTIKMNREKNGLKPINLPLLNCSFNWIWFPFFSRRSPSDIRNKGY